MSKMTSSTLTLRAVAPLVLLLGAGCNRYALFNQAGYEQSSFSDDADILFVIDNSASMAEETAALGSNFDAFIQTLTSSEGASPATDNLSDAVDNFVVYTQQRGKFLDYNLALTSTAGGFDGGSPDVGEAGRFFAAPVSKADDDAGNAFRRQLLCEAAYWQGADIEPGETMDVCDTPPLDAEGRPTITEGYLDCFCGPGAWEDNLQGSGREEPLEAALLALCRASPEPPELCYDGRSVFADTEEFSNEGWLRDDSTVLIVIVSDEGDDSRRLTTGDDIAQAYLDAFAAFDRTIKVVAIAPGIKEDTGAVICPSTTIPTQSIARLMDVTETTGGFYRSIAEGEGESCRVSPFDEYLRDLGALLANLTTAFQLQSVPDVSTIRVWINDEVVPQSPVLSGELGQPDATYGPGWSYDPAENAITFWGKYVPDYNADVDIYYRPLSGAPRELPF